MQKDKFFYPESNIYDLPLYGNQFIPLGIKTNLNERIRIQAMFDGFCNGGSILHANIDTPFDSYDKAYKMTCYIADAGVTYFAFNTKIQACEDNHAFYGTTCPVCGKRFFKKQYSQSFCSLHCKDSFWNSNQKNKRQGGGGHGNDSSACATVAARNLSFNNDNGQRLGVNVFSW